MQKKISLFLDKYFPYLHNTIKLHRFLVRARKASSLETRYAVELKQIQNQTLKILCCPKKTALDIGANYGTVSYLLAQNSKDVIAFEPLPLLARYVEKLAHKARLPIRVENCALSNEDGEAVIQTPRGYNGCTTLEQNNNHFLSLAKYSEVIRTKIKLRTLDSYRFDALSVIKIDVEGHQAPLLDGAKKTIATHKPHIFIEIDNTQHPESTKTIPLILKDMDYIGYFQGGPGLLISMKYFTDEQFHRPPRKDKNHVWINDFFFFHKDRIAELKDTEKYGIEFLD